MQQMPRLWPQTFGLSNQSQSRQGSEEMSVGHSNQKKTCAMVAKSHEDCEEALRCVNLERLRSSGDSKKSSLNGLASNDDAICSAACTVWSDLHWME